MLSKRELTLKRNHTHSEYLKILRGRKRGDPICPTLFHICCDD